MAESKSCAVLPSNHGLFQSTRYTPIINPQPRIIPDTNPPLHYFTVAARETPIGRLAILHGYGDHAGHYFELMQFMADHQIASAAIEFRGHGRSGGKPGFVRHWDDHLTDLTAFLNVDELKPDNNQPPLFLFAHSHGGLVAAVAAMRGLLPNIRGVILSAPYLELKMPIPRLKRFIAAIASAVHPSMQIRSGVNGPLLTRDPAMIDESHHDPFIRGIATPRWFYQTRKTQSQTRAAAATFNMPLLMLVPGQDSIANPDASFAFFKAAASADKTLLHYPDHLHELVREIGREEIFQQILNWMQQRLSAR